MGWHDSEPSPPARDVQKLDSEAPPAIKKVATTQLVQVTVRAMRSVWAPDDPGLQVLLSGKCGGGKFALIEAGECASV